MYAVSIELLLKYFFDSRTGFQHTILAHDENHVLVIYGKAQMSSKYVGVMHPRPHLLDIDVVKKKYLLPDRPYTEIARGKRTLNCINYAKTMQIPAYPLNRKICKTLNTHTIQLPKSLVVDKVIAKVAVRTEKRIRPAKNTNIYKKSKYKRPDVMELFSKWYKKHAKK